MITILHTESSMGWGGQEIRIVQESAGISARGNRVIIAAPGRSKVFTRAKEAGLEVVPAEFNKKNPLSMFRAAAIIDRIRPDILNTHSSSDSWVACFGAKLSRTKPKIIRTRHLSTPIGRTITSRFIYSMLPDAIFTTGEEIRQRMIRHNGFRASMIHSVPTGIDISLFDPDKVRPALKAEGFLIGIVGVLRSWKGHMYFLEAIPKILSSIPDARFYIAGDGPQWEKIEAVISERSLGDRVIMLGHREDIPGILASLDVVVHPSYANEGVPQTILQAFAMSKPVVASDTGAIKEVVKDRKTGLLIAPRNPEQIAERVIELHDSPDLQGGLGREARRLVEEGYSFDHMIRKIEDLYEGLLVS